MQRAVRQLQLFSDEAADRRAAPGGLDGLTVRESKRARRLSIKVFPHGRVEVVVPRRTRPGDVERFVSDNREWILAAREELTGGRPPEEFELPREVTLAALGRSFEVRYVSVPALRHVRWRATGDTVTLRGPVADEAQCVRALKGWLAAVAKREFAPRLAALSAETGIGYARMQVRAQRSCWGSRSSSGTLSLNLSLLFLRPELLRYLLIHELCHGRHMNHSRRFWSLVGRFEPNYRTLDRELGESWRDVPLWLGLVW